jgi:predicted dehydrogenase
MLYLVNSPPREVFAWADNKGRPVDINGVAVIKFANGAMGSLTCGGNCCMFKTHLTVQGRKAMMDIGPHGGHFMVQSKKMKEPIVAVPKGWKIPTVSPARNFADAILGKAKPRCPGTLGIMMADLMDGLYASVRSGKPVRMTKKVTV